MIDLKLTTRLADLLNLKYEIEDGLVMVYENPIDYISTANESMERIGTMHDGYKILGVEFNPLKNYNDLMPLVIEHGIDTQTNVSNLVHVFKYHPRLQSCSVRMAVAYRDDEDFENKYKRALVACLIAILETKNDENNYLE